MTTIVKREKRASSMTPKQHAFVQARLKGLNCVQAAQAAGYATPNVQGYQMESNPTIMAALKRERERAERVSDMSKKRVMDGMLHAIDQAKLLADPTAQISGWREIAKMCGYYEPKKVQLEVSVSAKRMFSQFETLSDAELLKLAETEIIDVDGVFVEDGESEGEAQ
jgi:phage terminase small subunit